MTTAARTGIVAKGAFPRRELITDWKLKLAYAEISEELEEFLPEICECRMSRIITRLETVIYQTEDKIFGFLFANVFLVQ